MSIIPLITATVAVAAWYSIAITSFIDLVNSDGSWYNGLREEYGDDGIAPIAEVPFTAKARYTIENRVNLQKTLPFVYGVAALIGLTTYVLTVGVLAIIGA